jgi:hypothetical protein
MATHDDDKVVVSREHAELAAQQLGVSVRWLMKNYWADCRIAATQPREEVSWKWETPSAN